MRTCLWGILVVGMVFSAAASPPPARLSAPRAATERVRPNDNRRPAGVTRGGNRTLRLEGRVAMWHPDGDSAPGAPMAAFAEEGGEALIPGPLLRVSAGTEVEASVRNMLRDTLVVHGLHARTGTRAPASSPMRLAPGERRTVRFRLDAAGAYYYWGTTTGRGVDFRTLEDAQLSGAIVVDDPAAGPPRDRVLVIGMWTDTVHRARTHRRRVLGVINGRSWPHVERMEHRVGDTVRWRVINASADIHPMHLHGFYFRVDSPGARRAGTPASPRRLRLLVRAQRGSSIAVPRYAYALHERGPEPPPDSGVGHGPVLELVRHQPVRIMVVNRLSEPTAVHWHGIELESYYDGVPGFSGVGRRVTPIIAPGDSFTVHFTPPRAGTFIYHTHADEIRQQSAGLAGAIVVREHGAVRDPVTDIPLLISEPPAPEQQARGVILVNGRDPAAPIVLVEGVTYRLRFIQMSVSRSAVRVELFRDSAFSSWRPAAKDGADLPAAARTPAPSRTRLGIGETQDVEVTPMSAGAMRLELRGGLRWPAPGPLLATVPIVVRPASAAGTRGPP